MKNTFSRNYNKKSNLKRIHSSEHIHKNNYRKRGKYSLECQESLNYERYDSSCTDHRRTKYSKCPISFDDTKKILTNILTDASSDMAILTILSTNTNLKTFLSNLDGEKHKNEIQLILEITIKFAADNVTLKSNFRNYLLLLIESEFIEKRLFKFVTNEITDDTNNIDIFQSLLLFIQIFFTTIPKESYKHFYHLTKLIIKFVNPLPDLNEEVTKLIKAVIFISQVDKPYDEKILDKYDQHLPNDFRLISVYPTTDDLSVKKDRKAFLRSIKIKGSYNSVDDYLDTLFRLTREDFISPLREGVEFFQNPKNKKMPGMRIYRNVLIESCIISTQNGIVHYLQLNLSKLRNVKWKESKRFLYGSLMCLSYDEFQTISLATVVERNFLNLSKGRVLVKFENSIVNTSKVYTLLETTNLFESYKHVLVRLQQSNSENFAMKKYLVFSESNIQLPSYLLNNIHLSYRFSSKSTTNSLWRSDSESSNGFLFESDFESLNKFIYSPEYMSNERENLSLPSETINSTTENDQIFSNNDEFIVKPTLEDSIWPTCDFFHMDKHQYEAFKSALTNELTIIQGPPGTGKTYIGLQICKTLIENVCNKIKNFGPILIVCYTNHALDQFLEEISSFCQSIVRVGGRSKSEKIKPFLLQNLKDTKLLLSNKNNCYDKIRKLQVDFIPLQAQIKLSEYYLLNLSIVKPFMELNAYQFFQRNDMESWIMGIDNKRLDQKYDYDYDYLKNIIGYIIYKEIKNEIIEISREALKESTKKRNDNNNDNIFDDDSDIEINYINNERILDNDNKDERNLRREIQKKMKTMKKDLCCQEGNYYFKNGIKMKTTKRLFQKRVKIDNKMTADEINGIKNFSDLSLNSRWRLYRYWRSKFVDTLCDEMKILENEFKIIKTQIDEINFTEEQMVMKNKQIIGMTTTGAARYGTVLEKIQCKIIIVEEAAEVLESHIIGSLNVGCEHLILIGDHKQLKPSPTVYNLAKNYNLDVSLFERLVNNNLPYNTLTLQHRMRPEISEVMTFIYENLENHKSVLDYPDVLGVKGNLFFFDHDESETTNNEILSYSNQFEAKMVIGLCKRLLDNNIKSSSITILTLYSGQMFLLRSLMDKDFEGVRVCVVDNYQGEENEIILLSLVRSNEEEKIGFLKTENRICVSLSRAKHGLYVFGNFSLLSKQSNLWRNICKFLKEKNLLGSKLILSCQNHQEKEIIVSNPSDFYKYPKGGCNKPCKTILECGHFCKLSCHIIDKDHINLKCFEKCERKCVKGHCCARKCWEDCLKCLEMELKTIPGCGHTKLMECYKIPLSTDCSAKCECKLPCGHKCTKLCNQSCYPCLVKVNKKCSECGHINEQNCSDASCICTRPCKAKLSCGHICNSTCYFCKNDRLHHICDRQCKLNFVCGHENTTQCFSFDNFCNLKCQQECYHNKCTKLCGEECINCEEQCLWKCDHFQCTNKCYEFCNRPFCDAKCKKWIPCKICNKHFQCYGVCGEMCRNICVYCDGVFVTPSLLKNKSTMFLTLTTCGHTFESKFLDKYMNETTNERIQLKKCPTCKVIINNRSCFRYSNLLKIIFLDIKRVQKLFTNSNKDNLSSYFCCTFPDNFPQISEMAMKLDVTIFQKNVKKFTDLSIIKFDIYFNFLTNIEKHLFSCCAGDPQNVEYLYLLKCLKNLCNWINPYQRLFDKFEMELFYQEFIRIKLLLELTLGKFKEISLANMVDLINDLKTTKNFSDEISKNFIEKLKKLSSNTDFNGDIIADIFNCCKKVKEINFYRGIWYKCKNGHYYMIEENDSSSGCLKCKPYHSGKQYKN